MSETNRAYANNQRKSGAAKNARPLRTLSITVLLTAILYGVAFATGATSINLGLDLRGGTSVTLQPRLEAGQEGQVQRKQSIKLSQLFASVLIRSA